MEFIRELDIIAGYYVGSVSPSSVRDDYQWPDGFQQTISFISNPTEASHNDFKIRLYFRGTSEWEAVQDRRAEIRQEIEEIQADAERDVKERVAAAAADIQETHDVQLAEPEPETLTLDSPTLKDCEKPEPHLHCEIPGRSYGCLEDDGQPRCFKGAGPRTGHYRSKGHVAELQAIQAAA